MNFWGYLLAAVPSLMLEQVINRRRSEMQVPVSADELQRRFTYHPPRDEADVAAHAAIRDRLQACAEYAAKELPPGRELSVVLTKIEEAMFWANAALARARAPR